MTVFLTFVLSVAPLMTVTQQQTDASTLIGRLATVEPAQRRLTLLPEGGVDLVELFLNDNADVLLEDRELSLSELVIYTGRRVHVEYRLDEGRRLASRITVDAG